MPVRFCLALCAFGSLFSTADSVTLCPLTGFTPDSVSSCCRACSSQHGARAFHSACSAVADMPRSCSALAEGIRNSKSPSVSTIARFSMISHSETHSAWIFARHHSSALWSTMISLPSQPVALPTSATWSPSTVECACIRTFSSVPACMSTFADPADRAGAPAASAAQRQAGPPTRLPFRWEARCRRTISRGFEPNGLRFTQPW